MVSRCSGAKRLHAERDERDAASRGARARLRASTSAGLVSMQTSPVRSKRSRTRPSTRRDALQRQRRSAAAHVDARDFARPDLVGPPVDLGERGARVPLHELGPVGDLGVGTVGTAVAAEGDVQVERGPLEPRRRPARTRAARTPTAAPGPTRWRRRVVVASRESPLPGPLTSTAPSRARHSAAAAAPRRSPCTPRSRSPRSTRRERGSRPTRRRRRRPRRAGAGAASCRTGARADRPRELSTGSPARMRREQPIDDRRPLRRIEVELVSAVVGSLEVEHDADDRQPRIAHPLEERLDAVSGVAVDDVDDRGLGMARRANRRLDLGEVIASAKLVGAGQPVDADPHQVRRAVEAHGCRSCRGERGRSRYRAPR